jgi:hypothetical protein
MVESVGHSVVGLHRTRISSFMLGDVEEGEVQGLGSDEVRVTTGGGGAVVRGRGGGRGRGGRAGERRGGMGGRGRGGDAGGRWGR